MRVAAGKRNRQIRGPLTDAGRARLRQLALQNQPWRFSTGPRTVAGKATAASNGKRRQRREMSVRELRAQVGDVDGLIAQLAALRVSLTGAAGRD